MKKAAFHNLGCKVNAYEVEVMQQKMEEDGYEIVPFAPGADIYIINTCTVTNIADRKSRQMLHRAKSMNPDAVVVAVGCYVQTGREDLETDACIDLAIGNNKKKEIASILKEYLERRDGEKERDKTLQGTTILDINRRDQEYEEMTLSRTGSHTRAYVKIQDGCNQFCSYCIIPYARGRVRSRRQEDILKEVKGLVDSGYREVVITGIHLSSYGVDFAPGKGELIEVLERLNEVRGLRRIRLGSLEPGIITESFADRMGALDKLCPHFHLSLQSGCNATLKRMNRRYTTEEFRDKTVLLRSRFDHPAITTDVIVGFPGETEEEFAVTKAFLEEMEFYEMHIFKYSRRQGTPAAERKDQIPDSVKSERSNVLLRLTEEQSRRYRRGLLGQTLEMLVEERKEIGGKQYQIGVTPSYVKAAAELSGDMTNRFVTGRAEEILENEYLLLR
ncbi:MAG: tRNA (N(6)-L-threonylcarbamoyladenosine(37)-C(2))-methylthiotransferase MtaB [Lachnospiraceae bacterium]|nr:tRNA (N(6)-L-threonylcarbamoyladenosine(37)-C(2))-methylthiotransferase MtaB [Lachnospiraceae bacterium]